MKLVGVAMVRNEADIFEACVRHNLRYLDALLVLDHCCDDGTERIIAALLAEGLPLRVTRDDQDAYRQAETTTELARAAFAAGADVVVPIDADEFLKMPSRAGLRRTLQNLPAGVWPVLQWQTYVPEPVASAATPLAMARRRRAVEAHGLHKVVLTQAFARLAHASLGMGNHVVLTHGPAQDLRTTPERMAVLTPGIAALGHLPVRSVAQLVAKVETGWKAHLAARRTDPTLAFHWRELHGEFAARGPPTPARLQEIAANYGLPMARWQPLAEIPLVEDPLPVGPPVRYAHLARSSHRA